MITLVKKKKKDLSIWLAFLVEAVLPQSRRIKITA